jgi:hypothetical protein
VGDAAWKAAKEVSSPSHQRRRKQQQRHLQGHAAMQATTSASQLILAGDVGATGRGGWLLPACCLHKYLGRLRPNLFSQARLMRVAGPLSNTIRSMYRSQSVCQFHLYIAQHTGSRSQHVVRVSGLRQGGRSVMGIHHCTMPHPSQSTKTGWPLFNPWLLSVRSHSG